jgi:hypothetical protein
MEPCDECGWRDAGGREGCRQRFDQLIARDFSDALYFRTHRLFVDTYCLQHPDQFCRSAKSLAAHLVGLCWILECNASPAVGPKQLHHWLNGPRQLDKPGLPSSYGQRTIGNLPVDADPRAWGEVVWTWAEETWRAYSELHPLARDWLARAARG